MLPKRYRLTKSEFQAVRAHGQLYSARLVAILIIQNSEFRIQNLYPKAGLIVSRRLSPKAIVRNRLKRRLRASLQRVLPQISPNLHLVILPNHRALAATVAEIEKEIKELIINQMKID